jgi:4-alpha-glucanotransferase
MDDLTDERQQANLPGSVTEYSNWRGRLKRSLEEMVGDDNLHAAMMAIDVERKP